MQPFINPYLFQSPGYQFANQMMQQPNTAGISGKYVNDFNEVNANDVPMNGMPAVFIKTDRSEIQMREWSPNGQITPTTYRIVAENPQIVEPKTEYFDKAEILDPILAKLTEFEEQLAKLKPAQTKKVTQND